jgi:hypothetical protein
MHIANLSESSAVYRTSVDPALASQVAVFGADVAGYIGDLSSRNPVPLLLKALSTFGVISDKVAPIANILKQVMQINADNTATISYPAGLRTASLKRPGAGLTAPAFC